MQPMMFGFETEYKLTKFMEDTQDDFIDQMGDGFVSRLPSNNEVVSKYESQPKYIQQENLTMQRAQSSEPSRVVDASQYDSDDEEKGRLKSTQLIAELDQRPIAIVGSGVGGSELKLNSNRETNKEKWKWGVNMYSSNFIGATKMKISIQDVHLIF